jgi:hypothetical protein
LEKKELSKKAHHTQMASQNIKFGLFGPGFLFWGEFLHFFDQKNDSHWNPTTVRTKVSK